MPQSLDINLSYTIAVLGGVLSFSLTSAFHCAGMCGPLKFSLVKTKLGAGLYHFGRFLSYLSLALGIHFLTLSAVVKFQRVDSAWVFVLLSLLLLTVLVYLFMDKIKNLGGRLSQRFFLVIQKVQDSPFKSFLLGVLTGLFPCGVLYAFLLSIAMVEEVWLLVTSVMIFVSISGLGVNFSSYLLSRFRFSSPLKQRAFVVGIILISYGMLIHRLVGNQIIGACFS